MMTALDILVQKNREKEPLVGKSVLVCTHATTATTKLITALTTLGAHVTYVPVSYAGRALDDDLGSDVTVVKTALEAVGRELPTTDIILEDGMRISEVIYENPVKCEWKEHLYTIEQTTNGIRRFENITKSEILYPVMNLAEVDIKCEMENSIATPESILSTLIIKESLTLSQKNILVLGYGTVGRGIARLCSAHGGVVTVVEEDSVQRAVASSHGFTTVDVRDIDGVLTHQDIVISCTQNGVGHTLNLERIMLMRDGSLIVNTGTGTGEVSPDVLTSGVYERNRAVVTISKNKEGCISCNFEKMGMKKVVKIVCSATPLNLGCGNGTTDEVIDIVFATALAVMIGVNSRQLSNSIHHINTDIKNQVARMLWPPTYNKTPCHIKRNDLKGEDRPWGRLCRFTTPEDALPLTNFSMARASFKPGSTTDGHYHAVSEEVYMVESGSADILVWNPKNIDEECRTYHVDVGNCLTIPHGMAHRVFADAIKGFTCVVVASPPFSFWDQFFPEDIPEYVEMFDHKECVSCYT